MAGSTAEQVPTSSSRALRVTTLVNGLLFGVLAWVPEFVDFSAPGWGVIQSSFGLVAVLQLTTVCFWSRAERWARLVGRLSLPLLSITFAWTAVELGSWVLLTYSPTAEYVETWEFRRRRPPPYQNAAFFSSEFLEESMRSVRDVKIPAGRNYMLCGDVKGKYFNVANGRRRTTGQPPVASRRVLVFGGSTVFCIETPDDQTLPSCIQREINRRCRESCRVENHSSVSMSALQQTARLKDTPLKEGDVVLFYDGFNDVFHPVYCRNFLGKLPTAERNIQNAGVRKLNWVEKTTYPVWLRFHDWSPFSRLMLQRYSKIGMIRRPDREYLTTNLKTAAHNLKTTLEEAAVITEKQGGQFVHVLQPNLFTSSSPTGYERRIAKNELIRLPGLDRAIETAYPRYRQITNEINGKGVLSFDLSSALDERPEDCEYFLDYCHVNHTANQRIAALIVDRLIQADVLPKR